MPTIDSIVQTPEARMTSVLQPDADEEKERWLQVGSSMQQLGSDLLDM